MKDVDPDVSNVDLEVAKAAIEGVLLTNLADGVIMLAQHYPMVTTHVQANLCSEPATTPKKNSSTIATGNTNRAALPQLPNKFAELLMADLGGWDEDPRTQEVVHDIKAQAKQVDGPLVALPCNRSRKTQRMSHAEAHSSDCYSTLCLPSSFSLLNTSTPVAKSTSPTLSQGAAGGFSVLGLDERNNNSPNTKEMVLRRSSRLKNKKQQQHQGARADVQHTPKADDEKENSLRAAQEMNSLNVADKVTRAKSTATKPKRRLAKPCIKGKQAKEPAREAAHKAAVEAPAERKKQLKKRSLIARLVVKSHFAVKKEATGLPSIRDKKEQTEKKAEEVEGEEQEEQEQEEQEQEQEQEQEEAQEQDKEDTEKMDKTHVKRVQVLMSAEQEEPRRDDPLPAEQFNDAEEDECQRTNPSCKAPAEQEVDRQQPKTSEQLFQRQTNTTAIATSKSGEELVADLVDTSSGASSSSSFSSPGTPSSSATNKSSSSPLLKPKKKTSAELMPPPAPIIFSHTSATTNNSNAGGSSPSSRRFSSTYSISSSFPSASSLSSSPPVHSNYEMTPYQSSDEETDSENEEKLKKIPGWACKEELLLEVQHQAQTDPDEIFCMKHWDTLDLEEIFKYNCSRFTHRRSSGNWTEDRLTFLETREYKRKMGFIK
ncbi:hypothetical protein QOT17_016030 [Balamuthia mandrillaris]